MLNKNREHEFNEVLTNSAISIVSDSKILMMIEDTFQDINKNILKKNRLYTQRKMSFLQKLYQELFSRKIEPGLEKIVHDYHASYIPTESRTPKLSELEPGTYKVWTVDDFRDRKNI